MSNLIKILYISAGTNVTDYGLSNYEKEAYINPNQIVYIGPIQSRRVNSKTVYYYVLNMVDKTCFVILTKKNQYLYLEDCINNNQENISSKKHLNSKKRK